MANLHNKYVSRKAICRNFYVGGGLGSFNIKVLTLPT